MKVLLTNYDLTARAGSQLYVFDVAVRLLKTGHTPIVFSPEHGQVANELRAATVPVVKDLNDIGTPPDVIHGQQLFETMAALLRFPQTPAVFFHHDWHTTSNNIPRFPRVLRYVAVDFACRDRLLYENGLPESRVSVVFNFADLSRFRPRGPLPEKPARALLLSNYARDNESLRIVREACMAAGISLDVVGESAGNSSAEPEKLLANYDLVFAKGRAAIEALAVGCAVILLGIGRLGPMVTAADFARLRAFNFGSRAIPLPLEKSAVEGQLRLYDAADAAAVTAQIRAHSSRDQAVEQIVAIYADVIEEYGQTPVTDAEAELRATADYLADIHRRLSRSRAERLRQLSSFGETSPARRMMSVPVIGKLTRLTLKAGKKVRATWRTL